MYLVGSYQVLDRLLSAVVFGGDEKHAASLLRHHAVGCVGDDGLCLVLAVLLQVVQDALVGLPTVRGLERCNVLTHYHARSQHNCHLRGLVRHVEARVVRDLVRVGIRRRLTREG